MVAGILRLKFTDDNVQRGEHKPYLQGVLSTFVKFPAVVFNEVHLEYYLKKKVFGGSVDVIVGSQMNGNKPYIYVQPKNVSIYLGSLLEAKSSHTRLGTSQSEM